MEQKFDFNESGVQAMTDMLYSLPAVDFMNSLQLLQIDFAAWVKHYFNLNADQEAYLENDLTPIFKGQCQSLLLLALSQRLAIRLEKDESNKPSSEKDDDQQGVGKMIGIDLNPEKDGKQSATKGGGVPNTELVFRIWYEDRA